MWKSSTSTEARALARIGLLATVLFSAGCATGPDPVQLKVDELDSRVARIDRASSQGMVQISQQLEALQQQVRSLNGRIDELQNANETLRREQRDLYTDLDTRLGTAAAAAAAATVGAGGVAAGQPPVADEQARYDAAFTALKNRDYATAVDGLRSLAAAYPDGQLADNTQYWLGEVYYVTQEFDHAAAAFQRVLTGWPDSRKAPDALLKLGYTQIEQKKLAAGKETLQQVVARYPDSDAAKLAAERLTKLPAG